MQTGRWVDIRPQSACKACATISAAPIPPAVIGGGLAAVGLLVWIIISKYLDCLCHCIVWNRSPPAIRSSCPGLPWPNGPAASASRYNPWPTGLPGICCKATPCMPTKPRYRNSTPVTAKPASPTCGLTAATTWNQARRSSSSTTNRAGAAGMRASSGVTGEVILLVDDYAGEGRGNQRRAPQFGSLGLWIGAYGRTVLGAAFIMLSASAWIGLTLKVCWTCRFCDASFD